MTIRLYRQIEIDRANHAKELLNHANELENLKRQLEASKAARKLDEND
jgi:hypothetical protein